MLFGRIDLNASVPNTRQCNVHMLSMRTINKRLEFLQKSRRFHLEAGILLPYPFCDALGVQFFSVERGEVCQFKLHLLIDENVAYKPGIVEIGTAGGSHFFESVPDVCHDEKSANVENDTKQINCASLSFKTVPRVRREPKHG